MTADLLETPLHNPFVTSQGATSLARAVAVTIQMSDGRTAQGESVPVRYVTGETSVFPTNCGRSCHAKFGSFHTCHECAGRMGTGALLSRQWWCAFQ